MNSGLTIEELIARDDEIIRQRAHAKAEASPISGMDPALLKQAMDDAKEVRAQALRNARKALEEAFGKRFEEVFAEKLAQEYERDGTAGDPQDLRR